MTSDKKRTKLMQFFVKLILWRSNWQLSKKPASLYLQVWSFLLCFNRAVTFATLIMMFSCFNGKSYYHYTNNQEGDNLNFLSHDKGLFKFILIPIQRWTGTQVLNWFGCFDISEMALQELPIR